MMGTFCHSGIFLIYKFSSHFPELGELSGVAAILRFPLPEPESDEDDSSSSDESWGVRSLWSLIAMLISASCPNS